MKEKETVMEILGWFFLVIILVALSTVWQAFVLVKLWAWFVVPVFALPVLTLAPSAGLALTASWLLRPWPQADEKPFKERLAELSVRAFTAPLIALFLGWLIQFFM